MFKILHNSITVLIFVLSITKSPAQGYKLRKKEMTTTVTTSENRILIGNDLWANMVDDNYFIPVQFSNSDKVEVLRFIDNSNCLATEKNCREFYKHLHFALNVCVSAGWAAFEDHLSRNGYGLEFVGLMDADQFKKEYHHILSELQYQY